MSSNLAMDNTGIELLYKKPSGVVLSASQVDVWDRCKRRWALEYIAKIRTPSHPSAILGGKVHAHLEEWLRDGTPPQAKSNLAVDVKAAAIAVRMIATLVKNGIQIGQGVVERRFWFRTRLGHVYTGFIDWSGMVRDEDPRNDLILPTVTDHKTSGNMRYAKTEADLHSDLQAVLYSVVAFKGFGTDTLRLFWNYGCTKGKFDTKAVKTIVHLPVVMEKFERVIEVEAAQIISHREAGTDPYAFPVSPQSCGDFGGCPHQHRCGLTPAQQLEGTKPMIEPTMQERMAQQHPNGAQQQPYQQQALPGQALPGQQPLPGQVQQALPGQVQQQPPPVQQQALPGQVQQQYQQPGLPGVTQQQQPPPVSAPPVHQLPGQVQQPPPVQGQPLPGQGQQPLPGQGQLPAQGAPPPPVTTTVASYAPDLAPNPPEGQGPPPVTAPAETAVATTTKGKSRAKATLNVDQQVFMMGVTAAMQGIRDPQNPDRPPALAAAGELALAVFHQKFG